MVGPFGSDSPIPASPPNVVFVVTGLERSSGRSQVTHRQPAGFPPALAAHPGRSPSTRGEGYESRATIPPSLASTIGNSSNR